MTLVVAVAYVAAGACLLAAVTIRMDRAVLRRLGREARSHRPSVPARIGARVPFAVSRVVADRVAELEMNEDAVNGLRGRKLLLAAAGAGLGIAVGGAAALPLAAVLCATGFAAPDVALARDAAASRRQVAAEVPKLLDVLAVSVSAGLSPRLALDRAPEAVDGRLRRELRRAHDDVALGAPWRAAFRTVAERTGSADLRRLAVTLDRSERLGSPVAERLGALARDVRSERRARREERARRAPVQMLFPLVFMILPAFVLAAVVPAVIVATRGLS